MGREILENKLTQFKEAIEDALKECNSDSEFEYLNSLIGSYEKLGGDSKKYREKYMNLLEAMSN